MALARFFALSLIALAMIGCPHESDPDSPRLVGEYEADDPRHLLLGSKRLVVTDAHHLRTDDGKIYEYSINEEFFTIDVTGADDLTYFYSVDAISFEHMNKAMNDPQVIAYTRIR